jgi:hypothetical protein
MMMKTLTAYLLAFVLSFYALDCSGKKNVPQAKRFPLGEYQYTGYDENGVKVVEGRLSITSLEAEQVKGTWEFKQIGEGKRIGPQVGSGDLVGSVNGKEVYINLNPNWADNNVNLRGKVEGNRYRGSWSHDGFAGSMSAGTFEATGK